MRTFLKSLVPKFLLNFLRERRNQQAEQQYFRQGETSVVCGAYTLVVPENHLLAKLKQPYRDMCVGIAAKYLGLKYPNATMVDIGANVGDTAALMATHARSKLILVEASEYFLGFLRRNVSAFKNEVVVKQVLVSDGSLVSGHFHHWAGTASFVQEEQGSLKLQSERLQDLADENTCFVKTDTDGYDFGILMDSLNWLAAVHPAILFENQIRSVEELERANQLYLELQKIGYRWFIVWDDPGFHILSTSSFEALADLNRYLLKISQSEGRKSISNYDVLCLHYKDEDVFASIHDWCKTY